MRMFVVLVPVLMIMIVTLQPAKKILERLAPVCINSNDMLQVYISFHRPIDRRR